MKFRKFRNMTPFLAHGILEGVFEELLGKKDLTDFEKKLLNQISEQEEELEQKDRFEALEKQIELLWEVIGGSDVVMSAMLKLGTRPRFPKKKL